MTNRQKKLKEDLAQLAAEAETDHELQMARSQLYKMAKYSIKLHEMLKGTADLEAWQAAKITKASDYLSSVYHSLDYDMSPANAGTPLDQKIDTPESRDYADNLHKRLKEEIKFHSDPSGVAYYKIVRKPTGFRILLGLDPEKLTTRNAERLSGDLRPDQIKPELERYQRQGNFRDIKPYDNKTEKIVSKL